MKKLLLIVITLLTLTVSGLSVTAQDCPDTTVLYGRTLSPDLAPVRNARVYAVPQHGGPIHSTYSNAFGYYSLAVPVCDNYAASVTYRSSWYWPVSIVFLIEEAPATENIDFVAYATN